MLPPALVSTDQLHVERGDSESADGAALSPQFRKRPAEDGRAGGSLRRRLCLSLGADLDQLLQDEAKRGGTEAARLNRLNLICSSLSLHHGLSTSSLSSCSTPPRCHSFGDLVEEGRRRRNSPAASAKAHDHDRFRQVRASQLSCSQPPARGPVAARRPSKAGP